MSVNNITKKRANMRFKQKQEEEQVKVTLEQGKEGKDSDVMLFLVKRKTGKARLGKKVTAD